MSKSELISAIHRLNHTAGRDFLNRFGEKELAAYLARIERTHLIPCPPYVVHPRPPIGSRWI